LIYHGVPLFCGKRFGHFENLHGSFHGILKNSKFLIGVDSFSHSPPLHFTGSPGEGTFVQKLPSALPLEPPTSSLFP
jgi:hypothetical protein